MESGLNTRPDDKGRKPVELSLIEWFGWMSFVDWLGLFVFLLCYVGYPILYDLTRQNRDLRFRADVYRELREAAGEGSETEEGRRLLSAAFRTHVRIFIFLGTVSFLAGVGAFILFLSSRRTGELLSFSLFYRVDSLTGIRFRLLVFMLLAGYGFLQFVWGLRDLYNLTHAVHRKTRETVYDYLSYVDREFERGLRTLYYLVVLFLWFFGPEFLIIGAVVLTVLLYRYDFLKTKD